VEITDKVSTFHFEGHTYRPGDKVTLPKSLFRPDSMKLISPDKVESTKEGAPPVALAESPRDESKHKPDKDARYRIAK
jgi:hypothetical protein